MVSCRVLVHCSDTWLRSRYEATMAPICNYYICNIYIYRWCFPWPEWLDLLMDFQDIARQASLMVLFFVMILLLVDVVRFATWNLDASPWSCHSACWDCSLLFVLHRSQISETLPLAWLWLAGRSCPCPKDNITVQEAVKQIIAKPLG